MLPNALLAYVHYISFLAVVSTLVTELILFRETLTPRERRLLQRVDAIYGVSAILVVITGFSRVYFLAKGSEYYYHNYIFLAKVGMFLIVGILSIYPTVVFLRWRKNVSASETLKLEEIQYNRISRMILAEVIIIFLIPLLASLMARGIGFYG